MATTPTTKRKRRTLRDIITHNWQQKLISLLCALTVFVVVFYDRNMSVSFEKIPVSFKIPDGYALVEGPAESTVDVRVYGRASQLREISRDDLGVITLTPPPREGNVQVTLLNSMISLPDGVRIEKTLGTRHRAAIGLSESTDAVIVVVSEETGIISVAHNEQLTRRLSPEALRDYLHQVFVQPHIHKDQEAVSSTLVRKYRQWRKHKG